MNSIYVVGIYFFFGLLSHLFFRKFNPKTEMMADVDWMMIVLCYLGGPLSLVGFALGQIVIELEKEK